MGSRDKSIKQAFRDYLAEHRPAVIGETEWGQLLMALAPVSESYLRELLRNAAVPVAQPWAGVRQHTLEDLEQSLLDLLEVYAQAVASSDGARARYCRRQVIAAKDRARFAARNPRTPQETRARKEEMIQWMLVWLEDPPTFPAWVEIRKRKLATS